MTGEYKFREDLAIADIAFEVKADTLEEVFKYAALAITNSMVSDLKKINQRKIKEINLKNENLEFLLFDFLQEIIFLKDSEKLLFSKYEIKIIKNKEYTLNAKLYGEELNVYKHELLVDVKAVTMHMFELKKENERWFARVILDV